MKQKNYQTPNIGTSLILVIFVILCLCVFSALSLISANSDKTLVEKLKTHTDEYYAASTLASSQLDTIDHTLSDIYKQSDSSESYYALCSKTLTDTYDSDTQLLSYTCTISDTQELLVVLKVLYPTDGQDTFYQITSWKVVSTATWNPDSKVTLIPVN